MSAASDPLTLARVFTSWQVDPLALVLIAALGSGYVWGLRRQPEWPRARSVAFFALGLGGLLLVSITFVGVYEDTLFWARAVQIIVLLMTVPLGLAMGAPVTLLRQATSPVTVQRTDRVLASRPVRMLTHPATGSVLLLVTPWLLFFTDWYEAALRSDTIDVVTRLALLTIGFVYFYGRLQIDPLPRQFPHLLAVVISLVEVIFDAILGLVLWLGPQLVAETYYSALDRTWGPSLRFDQIIGAGVLWLGGDLVGLPFVGALMQRMSVRDSKEAAEIDKRLDETEAALEIPRDDQREDPDQPVMMRPWWEDDPELAERFWGRRRR